MINQGDELPDILQLFLIGTCLTVLISILPQNSNMAHRKPDIVAEKRYLNP
jgi:hypothetical protein